MQKLIIEARINEYASREGNKQVPWLPEEIARDAAECAEAGAAILHFHGRGADGAPDHRFECYRDIILATRAATDILLHPTLGYVTLDAPAEERIANIRRLAERPQTKPDFAPMDMGSFNVDLYDPAARRYVTQGLIYRNGTDTLTHFAGVIRGAGMTPYLSTWSVSAMRQIGTFLDMGVLAEPAFCCFILTGDNLPAGHPGTPEGLDAHTPFLPKNHRVEWAACNYNGDLLKLVDKIVAEGGHVAIGLGDYPYEEYGRPSNAELVRRVAETARRLGREVATVDETRQILGVRPRA
jgi:3-keto-5-aminohexanoate cleavage enzyme